MRRNGPRHVIGNPDVLPALVALAVIAALMLAPPHSLLEKADQAAFGVCHRIPERTLALAGRPLPLCARCSGTYLSAAAGLLVLAARGRGRAGGFPRGPHVAVLGLFALLWAADGVNSFLTLFPGVRPLYEPSNLLRLGTGALQGLTLASVLLPALNLALWAAPGAGRSIERWGDLAWMVVGAAAVVALVASGWAPLLYPLAYASGLAIWGLLGAVNTMLAALVLRREGRAERWTQATLLILLGLALALVELAAIGVARTALTDALGLPF